MTQRHNIPEIFGITVDTIGQEITLEIDGATYEGTLSAVAGDDVTLTDYTRTTNNDHYPHQARTITLTLTSRSRVWLDLHEDDFECVNGVVTLADDGTI